MCGSFEFILRRSHYRAIKADDCSAGNAFQSCHLQRFNSAECFSNESSSQRIGIAFGSDKLIKESCSISYPLLSTFAYVFSSSRFAISAKTKHDAHTNCVHVWWCDLAAALHAPHYICVCKHILKLENNNNNPTDKGNKPRLIDRSPASKHPSAFNATSLNRGWWMSSTKCMQHQLRRRMHHQHMHVAVFFVVLLLLTYTVKRTCNRVLF